MPVQTQETYTVVPRERPFDIVAMDILGLLLKNMRRNLYVLAIAERVFIVARAILALMNTAL